VIKLNASAPSHEVVHHPGGAGAESLPDGSKNRPAVENHGTEPVTRPDRRELLRLWQEKWEALQRCRIREEKLADAGLPILPLIPLRVRLCHEALAAATKLRRMEAQELLERFAAAEQPTQVPRRGDDGESLPENPLVGTSNDPPGADAAANGPIVMMRSLFMHTWDAIEHCHIGEKLAVGKGLSVGVFADAQIKLALLMTAIADEMRRCDAQAFFIECAAASEGSPPASLSDAAKRALRGTLEQFSAKDRKVLRQIWDRARPNETLVFRGGSRLKVFL